MVAVAALPQGQDLLSAMPAQEGITASAMKITAFTLALRLTQERVP